ncbi:vegetative cell wall protein gp1 [Colletotrichum graminicola M1.001]|uniref:Vegetative cell wall protein gp1 n=1 Tax=Colletotrichum graminicola (strain M1.001 / M2 / FGSC 10212) TaxID=645133 RepID=E3Q5L4_COLGM|nr:vegetative cell wall protein gp1 [Colletotrichum graminicola M1.001]EFQ25981.1 vegetative cell wall protein gp1 [Colletotrichum graminicola M1.001]
MGFFDRKKVNKTAPSPVPVKPAPVNAPGHHHASSPPPPPPPPPPPRYATSTTQTPGYWQPRTQYHHPPPPYHHPQQQELQHRHQVQQQEQQQHRPQGWSQHPQRDPYAQPIVVNQHYYLHPPPPPSSHLALAAPPTTTATATASHAGGAGANPCPLGLDKFAGSVVTIAKDFASPHFLEEPNFHPHAAQLISSTAVCMDQIAGRFNDVMTLIDCDRLVGNEKALFSYPQDGGARKTTKRKGSSSSSSSSSSKGQSAAVTPSVVSGNYFAKVELYANSRLPMNLPPLRLYMPTWPILCMAAQYAERVYDNPKGAERDAHVSADWRTGTKAMVIKSVPMDHVGTIVFAIRGSASVQDWAVNLKAEPVPPAGFLDDPGNSCHAGFLDVARKTAIIDVTDNSSALRKSRALQKALDKFTNVTTETHFSRRHVGPGTFSLNRLKRRYFDGVTRLRPEYFVPEYTVRRLPLQRPDRPELRKSLFLTFVNEGDPVPRADKAYVKSLLELFAAPPPRESKPAISALVVGGGQEKKKKTDAGSRLAAKASKMSLTQAAKGCRDSSDRDGGSDGSRRRRRPVWNLPPSTLSSPGRIVVLRSGDPKARVKDRKTVAERLDEGVVAQTVTDEELRRVVWGDPVCHVMRLYSGRIETLAVGAVTGKHG